MRVYVGVYVGGWVGEWEERVKGTNHSGALIQYLQPSVSPT